MHDSRFAISSHSSRNVTFRKDIRIEVTWPFYLGLMIRWRDEMAVDYEFIERFEKEIKVLRDLQKAAEDAIERAENRIARIRHGESKEDVFGPIPPKK